MKFRPGELDKRITLLRPVRTPRLGGGYDESQEEIGTVWAHVRPLSGNEREQFDRVNGEAAYLFVIRNRDDITDNTLIQWEGETYNVRFPKGRGGRPLYLEIVGQRGVAQ